MGGQKSPLICLVFLGILVFASTTSTDTISDYAIDVDLNGNGYVDIPPIPGIGSEASFDIQFYQKTGSVATGCLFELANSATNTIIRLTLSNNAVYFTIGTKTVSTSSINGLQSGWHTVSVVVDQDGTSNNRQVSIFVDGIRYVKQNLQNADFPYIERSGRLGLLRNGGSPFNGMIDNFVIWKVVRADSDVFQLAQRSNWQFTDSESAQILVWFSFNEGFGNSVTAVTDTTAPGQRWIEAALVRAFFSVKNWNGLMYCRSWGDPHIYDWNGNWIWPGEKIEGTILFTSCKDIFEIRAYQRYTQWWCNTVTRITTIRAFDHFFQFSLEETWVPPGYSTAYPGKSLGVYERYGNTTGWKRIPAGSYTDSDGVFYTVTYNGGNQNFMVIIPNVGYVVLDTESRYTNIDIYLSQNFCPTNSRIMGACDGYLGAYRDIEFMDWKYPPIPADPQAPPQTNYCDEDPVFAAEASKACSKYGNHDSAPYKDCYWDVCVSGDPELTIGDPPTKECILNQLLAASGQTVNGTASCPVCKNDCSNRGNCTASGCVCDAGYVGDDCGTPNSWGCFNLDQFDGLSRHLDPVAATYRDVITSAYSYQVEDSVHFYLIDQPTSTASGASKLRYLFVAIDSTKSTDELNSLVIQVTFDVAIAANFNVTHVGSPKTTGYGSTTVNSAAKTVTLSYSWPAYSYAGSLLGPLPFPFCGTIKIVSSTGIRQVLVGSGGKSIDPIRIPSAQWGGFKICGQTCLADPCASIESCSDCAALAQCGFCVDNGRCVRGDNVGPLIGECQNWRFSFNDTISRRVTTEFGWPVSPSLTEVYLTSAPVGTLEVPVDVRVNMGEAQQVWDAFLMLEDVTTGSDAYVNVQNLITRKLLPALSDDSKYPEFRLGLGSFAHDDYQVKIMQTLSSVDSNNQWVFQRSLASMTGGAGLASPNGQMKSLYATAQTSTSLNWRTNARRMVIVVASADYCKGTGCDFTPQNTRDKLLNAHIVPVFLATESVYDSFQNLVNDVDELGFGLVLKVADDLSNLQTAVEKAIRLATGQISMVISQNGHIKTDEVTAEALNIFGLSNGFRARFIIPMEKAPAGQSSASLIAPGFGSTTINDIVSDKPTCVSSTITGDEDTDIVGTLQGQSFRNLLSIYPVIKTLPAKGTLYQVNADGTRGDQIVVGSIVTNPSGKLIYRAPANAYSFPVNSVFTSFDYFVTDGCAESPVAPVNVYVNPKNDAPVADPLVTSATEDVQSANNYLTYSDLDVSLSDNVTPQGLQVVLLENPDNSIAACGTNTVLVPGTKYPAAPSVSRTFCFNYNPKANYNGIYKFRYQVVDTDGALSNTATVSINVAAVNDAPAIDVGLPVVGLEDTRNPITVLASDVDGNDANVWTKLSIQLSWNASFVGTFYADNNTGSSPLTNGQTFTSGVYSGNYKVVLWYQAPSNVYSCWNNDTVVSEATATCPPATGFYVQAFDGDVVIPTYNLPSPKKNVNVYIFNTEDQPSVPAPFNVTVDEDATLTLQLNATDPDGGDVLSYLIAKQPQQVTLKQVPSGQTITWNVSNSQGFINIVPNSNVFGNSVNGWYLTEFQYQVFDGLMTSDTATVTINVRPINDAPVPLLTAVAAVEDTPLLVYLTASDIDSPLTSMTYVITQIPDAATQGTFYLNNNGQYGAAITTVPTTIPTGCGSSQNDTCLWFVPFADYYGSAPFAYTITDVDVYGTSSPKTVAQSAPISVAPVNDAPWATMSNPSVYEDTIMILTLTGYDKESDPLRSVIVTPLYSGDSDCALVGTMYQYNPSLALTASAYQASGVAITASGTAVSDYDGRVVYLPPSNKNTEETLNWNHVAPYFDYLVEERSSQSQPYNLSALSAPMRVLIMAQNDAPLVWDDSWSSGITDACYSTCTYDEDLDTHWRNPAGSVSLWFGGDDIEKGDLTVVLDTVDCSTNAILTEVPPYSSNVVPVGSGLNYALSTKISLTSPQLCADSNTGGSLIQALSFTPGLDEYDNTQNYYCKITYRVRDTEGALSSSKTITIQINPVNDEPRPDPPSSYQQTITILEDTTATLNLTGKDPEGDTIYLLLTGCAQPGIGAFVIAGSEWDCSTQALYSAPAGQFEVLFTPVSGSFSLAYNSLYYTYLDYQPTGFVNVAVLDTYTYTINVLPQNDVPSHSIMGISDSTANTLVINSGQVALRSNQGSRGVVLQLTVNDPDLTDASVQGNLTVSVSVVTVSSGGNTATISISPADVFVDQLVVTPTQIVFFGPQAAMQTTLARVAAKWPNTVITFRITVNVTDNGYLGVCPDTLQACTLWTASRTEFRATISGQLSSIVVGAAAAGAAIVAGLAGVGAWRRFNKPKDGYEPWKEIAMPDAGAVNNPMYEGGKLTGTNPFYVEPTAN